LSTNKKKNKVNTRRAILLRAYLVFGLALIFGLAVLLAAARLQMGSDKKFSAALREKNRRVQDIPAIRGNIYASDGSLLATSVPRYNMILDANADGLTNELFKNKIDSLSIKMASQFKEKTAAGWKIYFTELRRRKSRYAMLAKDLGYDVVKRMKTWPLINLGKFKSGIWYDEQGKRMYFMGELAKRTIGYSKQGVYIGLEGALDSFLKGKDGKRMEQRMPGNVWRPVHVGNFSDPINGLDIVTTLNINLQDVAQAALGRVLAENEADHGCAVVMEVSTGAIKAMANLKRGKDGNYTEAQNYAVDEFSEPGSTFKLVSVLALLEDGYCKPTDSVDVNGGKTNFYGEVMEDASKPNKRILNLQESFEKSSNVGISKFVVKYYAKSPQKFIDHSIRLGLNIKPNFDVRSSGNPRIKTVKSTDWSLTALPWMSIGYETQISPLQIATLYNAVANGGKMVKPYMVSEIHRDGMLLKKIETTVMNEKICSDETLKALQSMLEGVVDHGTATNIKNDDYTVAGKTGTAKIAKGKTYEEGSYKASFAGYFPANNPQYTVIVVINEPRKGKYYGALVAGPVFKAIADNIYSSSVKLHPGIPISAAAKMPFVLNGNLFFSKIVMNSLGISSHMDTGSTAMPWVKTKTSDFFITLSGVKTSPNIIPDVTGMGLRDAIQLLENRKLTVTFDGYGRITSQSIKAGSSLAKGASIHLNLNPF